MFTKIALRIFSLLVLTGLLILLAGPTPAGSLAASAAQVDPYSKIETQLLTELAAGGQADFFIHLNEKADLSAANRLPTKLQKGEYVFNTLRAYADASQKDLRAYLEAQGAAYTSFYIINAILVRGGTQDLLLAVASRPEVGRLTANHTYQLEPPTLSSVPKEPEEISTNIAFINTDDVWALGYTGQGMVVATNNTGLDWTHPAILSHYRGWNGTTANHNYNWYDATGTYLYEPADVAGGGSMITGIMVGDDGADNQIGMAPGAKAMMCKSVNDDWSTSEALALTCLEWDLAPWDLTGADPRPDLAPDVLDFSWGFEHGAWLRDAVDNLIAAGILVASENGNDWEGQGCSILTSPGDYQEVLSVGSVNPWDTELPGWLSWFSGRGPSLVDGDYFPMVMAPGEGVYSSTPGGEYGWTDGGGFAVPHAAGLVGLMWSANPNLIGQVEDTIQIIKDTAVPLTGQEGWGCGGDYINGPNNDWGYGTIDALAAVEAAIAYGGEAGTLQGTVTDAASSEPIPGASILATLSPTQTFHIFTDATGEYSLNLVAGTYTLDASAYGYAPEQVSGLEVEDGASLTQDFALDLLPTYVVSVTVEDANTGWPLYVQVSMLTTPLAPVWNDPLTGHFVVSVPEGLTFIMNVEAWTAGYVPQQVAVGPVMGDTELVVEMQPDLGACNAPGYEFIEGETILTEDFELSDGGYTIEGTNPSWEWVEPFAGPYSAHSGIMVWATDLYTDNYMGYPATYYDNENSYLVSPPIDLSGYAGNSFHLGWWQFLETEECCDYGRLQVTKDSGTTWKTVYGPKYGYIDQDWADHVAGVDPSYAVSNFQFRFNLVSDWWTVEQGWYVDDVSLQIGQCVPIEGGLVVGNVYDANTSLPIAGATVENEAGYSIHTTATEDEAVDDGFYMLFSPGGLQEFTASMNAYTPETADVEVISGSVVSQDFTLEAGLLVAEPSSLEATVELGDSATLPMTLTNQGGREASFALAEFDGGFQPVSKGNTLEGIVAALPLEPPVGPDVFIACADDHPCEPIASMLMAFGDIHSVTSYAARFGTPTLEQLLNYDVVVTWSAYEYADAVQMGNVLADYVDAGGKVIDLMFAIDGGLQGRFVDENYTALRGAWTPGTWACLGEYDASHPIMANITDVCDSARIIGTYLTPGSSTVARWAEGEIFVAVKENRSVATINMFVGFYSNWTGQADVLVHNTVMWLGEEDLPWLSETPGIGTLPAETGLQDVTVTFDAGVPDINQPGEYFAWVKVKTDTPYTPTYLPVRMTVTPPDSYGKLEGTVQGLGYCDGAPTPLEKASIGVVSGSGMAWTEKSDAAGHYQVWADATAGPLTVTVSASNHLQYVLTGVILTANQTVTQDFDLRSIQPCVSADPLSLDIFVPVSASKTQEVELINTGAGDTPLVNKDVEGTGFFVLPDPPDYGLVGVFKDWDPFYYGNTIVTDTMNALGIPFELHNSAEFETLDFSQFQMILIPSTQPYEFHDALAAYMTKFESFVDEGGILVFFSSTSSSTNLSFTLPGGTVYNLWFEYNNIVNDPTHPVVAGVPDPFWGDSASDGYFTDLPIGAHVIASEMDHGYPTIVEYPIGDGLVLALTTPVEFCWSWAPDIALIMTNAYSWGANMVPSLDAPWLAEDILTGTLAADSLLPVELTLTALPGMTAGEVYTATLYVMSKDTTQARIPVTVRMHIFSGKMYMPLIWKKEP